MSEVTNVLAAVERGDPRCRATPPARVCRATDPGSRSDGGRGPGNTLQPTALVHEAYLRLVESARRKNCVKHGGAFRRVDWLDAEVPGPADDEQILLLDEALTRLAAVRPQAAELIQLRFFSGLKVEEAAPLLGLSTRTARRLWVFARAWLRREMERVANPPT